MNRIALTFLTCLLGLVSPLTLISQRVMSVSETMDRQPMFWSWADALHDKLIDRDYSGGKLNITCRSTDSYWSYKSLPIQKRTDWSVSMKCMMRSSEGTGGFGLHLRAGSYHYYFKIAGKLGAYWVGTYNEASKTWGTFSKKNPDGTGDYPCSCILPNEQENELLVQRRGSRVQFIINKTTVEDFDVTTLPEVDTNLLSLGINVSQKVDGWIDDVTMSYVERPIVYHMNALKGAHKTFMSNLDARSGDRFAVLAPNGNSIYWVRTLETTRDDIFTASRVTDSTWSAPQNIGSGLNNNEPNNVTSVSQDDNELFIWGRYKPNGQWEGPGFTTARRSVSGWIVDKSIAIEDFVNKATSREECVSADRQVAIMACQRDDAFGGKDLYVSFLKGSTYTKPVNLGATLNSAWEEGMPYLAADNRTLYFASLRPGFGDADIWVSKRQDDSWLSWSPPINMGPYVNTVGWDAYFSIHPSGKYAYMNSNDGYKQGIVRLTLPNDPESKKLLPDPIVLVRGKVLDAKTRQPIGTDILIDDIRKQKQVATALSEPKEGKYSIALPAGKAYGFFASAKGYFPVSDNVIIDTLDSFVEVERDLLLQPIEVGAVIRLNNLFFDYDKSDLREESSSELERLISLLKSQPTMIIEIGGHTDDRGNDAYNKNLSEKRAKSVLWYLSKHGIATSRMTSKGYGKTKPVSKGATDAARQANRRVEFQIKSM